MTKCTVIITGIFLIITLLTGCNADDIPHCTDNVSLYTLSNFPIGTAIDFEELNFNPAYSEIAIKQFNSFTPENIFKADYIHPEQNVYNWTQTDSLSDFCLANKKRLHGHTLIWYKQIPQWILNYQGNSGDWEKLFKSHIQTLVSHFKGKVAAWDVVNEAFNEDGTLRNSIWREKLGDGYIEKAFIYAAEADPNALLFYNDFNLESNPNKCSSVLSLLNNLRNIGIKVDGIGLQMHINIYSAEPSQIASAFQNIADDGYKIHVSELDISLNPLGKDLNPDLELFNKQSVLLSRIVLQYKQIPPAYQYGITFWGISDKNSWIRTAYNRKDYPLLFDDNYLPKPAYCNLKETL